MPGCRDLTGQVFNYLTVIKKTNKRIRGNVIWKCRCKCGNEKEVTSVDLKHNRVMSCGCYNKELVSNNFNDLLGKQYGYLTVIEKTEKRTNNRSIVWKCRCKCGNETEVSSDALLRKNGVQSCGCKQKEWASSLGKTKGKNLIGQKFGKLTPIKLISIKGERGYLCKCDCGNYKEVLSAYLLGGHTSSCGCLTKSKGEFVIETILKENNINFISQYHNNTCKFDNGYYAYFDFYIPEKNYIIEFDGIQHFQQREWHEPLEKIQERDKIKNEWCYKNNIPLIRIPYWHLNEICLKDLKIETSDFIFKE